MSDATRRTQLAAHRIEIPGLIPDLETLKTNIVQDTTNGHHWWWKPRKPNRGFNSRGQAEFIVRIPVQEKHDYITRGAYTVVRALLQHQNTLPTGRSRIFNVCGLPQCVNPGHWHVEMPPSLFRLAQYQGVWHLVTTATGFPLDRNTSVSAHNTDGVVHRLDALTNGVFIACNAPIDLGQLVVTRAAVTCKGCL